MVELSQTNTRTGNKQISCLRHYLMVTHAWNDGAKKSTDGDMKRQDSFQNFHLDFRRNSYPVFSCLIGVLSFRFIACDSVWVLFRFQRTSVETQRSRRWRNTEEHGSRCRYVYVRTVRCNYLQVGRSACTRLTTYRRAVVSLTAASSSSQSSFCSSGSNRSMSASVMLRCCAGTLGRRDRPRIAIIWRCIINSRVCLFLQRTGKT